MRLYGILEADVLDAIKSPDTYDSEGKKTIVVKKFPNRFSGYPLKVVYESGDEFFVISAYPLKKAYRRQEP